jgi:hypothetical protein
MGGKAMSNALLIRRRGMMVAQQGGLPYDAEIEYLQADGNAYISLNYIPIDGNIIRAELVAGYGINNNQRKFLFSDSNSGVSHYCEIGSAQKFGAYNIYCSPVLQNGVMYDVIIEIGNTNVNYFLDYEGATYTSSVRNASTSYQNLVLFRISSSYKGIGQRIRSLKIYDNNTLVFDMFSVRVGQVGYMYDRVSGQLFGNAGTGAFVLGPDIQ